MGENPLTKMEDQTLQQHIEHDKEKLSDPNMNPQSRRYYSDEIEQLESYQKKHPKKTKDPSPFERYCDLNPDALECRIYEI